MKTLYTALVVTLVLVVGIHSQDHKDYKTGEHTKEIKSSKKCTTDDNCKYGEMCDNEVCKCPSSDRGELCDSVEEAACEEKIPKCEPSGGECKYNELRQIFCDCKLKIFHSGRNECIEDKCRMNCGEKDDVVCDWDILGEADVNCTCKNKTKEFDPREKLCKVNMCKVNCGNQDGVECEELLYSLVKCYCVDEKKIFIPEKKVCLDPCSRNPCKNGGTCTVKKGERICVCTSLWTGGNCEIEIDKCILKYRENKCSNVHETCKKTSGECICEKNYKYSEDKTKCIENFCGNKNACPENSDCKELGSGSVQCTCKGGYFMNGDKCVKISLCDPGISKCKQLCHNKNGKCSCLKDFTLASSDNATCIRKGDEPHCDPDCGVGVCIKEGKKNKCSCPTAGYVLVNGTCMDVCVAKVEKAITSWCPTNNCESNSDYRFRCKCEDPYEQHEDGVHCKRKVMCLESKVQRDCDIDGARCVEDLKDKKKGYRCVCDDGFEFDYGICKKKCEIKKYVQMCSKLGAVCSLNETYDVQCECPPVLSRETKGGPCNTIAKFSYLGIFSILKHKYKLKLSSGRSRRSTEDIDMSIDHNKLKIDLKESMKVVYNNYDNLKILKCENMYWLNYLYCKLELQLKSKPRDIRAISNPSTCLPLDSEYCWVKPNLILERSALLVSADPCDIYFDSRLCGKATTCSSDYWTKNFQCQCKVGFYAIASFNPVKSNETFIEKCDDINECERASACPDTTYCENTYGNYSCLCKDGFKRKNPESDPKADGCEALCDPNPCKNDGECIKVGNHGFSCKCKNSFVGILCSETSGITAKQVEQSRKKASIVGGVLGTLLIIFLIVGIVLYKTMKKSKGENDVYASNRQRGILSEVTGLGRRQQQNFGRDIEHNNSGRRPETSSRDSGEYRRHFSEAKMTPRVEGVSKNRDVSSEPEMSRKTPERQSREESR